MIGIGRLEEEKFLNFVFGVLASTWQGKSGESTGKGGIFEGPGIPPSSEAAQSYVAEPAGSQSV